ERAVAFSDAVDGVEELKVPRASDNDSVESHILNPEGRRPADGSDLYGQTVLLGHETEALRDLDDGHPTFEPAAATEVRAGFRTFHGDVTDDPRRVGRMRHDEGLRSSSADVA